MQKTHEMGSAGSAQHGIHEMGPSGREPKDAYELDSGDK